MHSPRPPLLAGRRALVLLAVLLGCLLTLGGVWQLGEVRQAAAEGRERTHAERRTRVLARLLTMHYQELAVAQRFAELLEPLDNTAFQQLAATLGPGSTLTAWAVPAEDEASGHRWPYVFSPVGDAASLLSGNDYGSLLKQAWQSRTIAVQVGISSVAPAYARELIALVAPVIGADRVTPRGAILLLVHPRDVMAAADTLTGTPLSTELRLKDGVRETLFVHPPQSQDHGEMAVRRTARLGGLEADIAVYPSPVKDTFFVRNDLWPALAGVCMTLLFAGWLSATLRIREKSWRQDQRREQALALLQDSGEASRWRQAVSSTGDGIWEWDALAGTVHFSPECAEMLGYKEAEMGSTLAGWDARLHPEERERVKAELQRHFRGETPHYECLQRTLCKNGKWKWILDRGRVVSWVSPGVPARMLGTYTDIDAYKRLEDEKDLANTYLNAVLNAATEVSIIASDQYGIIQIFNAGAERILGYPAQEIIGKVSPMFFHDEDEVASRGEVLSQQLGRPIQGFEVFVARARQERVEIGDWIYICQDGSRKTVRLMVSRVESGEGELVGFLGIALDVTRELMQENELKARDALLEKLSEQVPGVIYQYRAWPDGRVAFPFASEGLRRVYEVAPDAVREDATAVVSRLHPEDREAVMARIQESAETLQPWRQEYRVLLPSAGERWLRGEASPERMSDGGTLWYGYISDITLLKQLEMRLRDEATRDALTSALNRRELQRLGSQYLAAAGEDAPLSLLMLDLDDFKRVNDTFGHDAGDEVLKHAVALLTATARNTDLVFRTGGEELVVLCPDTDKDSAAILAGKILRAFRERPAAGLPVVTASIGIAEAAHGDTIADLLKRADTKVYQAKRAGKDCLML